MKNFSKSSRLYFKPLFFNSSETKPNTNYMSDPEFKKFITEDELSRNEALREKLHKFEREWKRLYEDQNQNDATKPLNELNEYQRKKVEFLVDKTHKLNMMERQYFTIKIRDNLVKTTGFNPLKINPEWPIYKKIAEGNPFPFNDPNMVKQQEAMAKLWPIGMPAMAGLFGGIGLGKGGAAGQSAAGGAQKEETSEGKGEEVKVQAPKDKDKFEIELESFDPAQKIKIIKEVRELFKLGLKDAKDLVEKAPALLKRGVPKEEAEKIQEKLIAMGCKVNLK